MKIQVHDFNLEATLDSAQVFGFTKSEAGIYEGVLEGVPVKVWQEKEWLHLSLRAERSNLPMASWRSPRRPEGLLAKTVSQYFDLDRDMDPVYEILSTDERLLKPFQTFRGLRIIRQNGWEALAGFIISANNNFKRIQGIWRNLSRSLSHDEYNFPLPEQIASSSEAKLRELGLGYRAPYLFQTAKFVAANPEVLDRIRSAGYKEAKERVMAFPGVGEKVADCVLLYGFQKYESFPVDVWIHRIVRKLYFRNRKMSERKIAEFGRKRWGHQAGFVQQFLFHGARSGIL